MDPTVEARVCSLWARPQASEIPDGEVFYRKPVEERCFVDATGLSCDISFAKFEASKKKTEDPTERAVLFQTVQHYEQLRAQFPAGTKFQGDVATFGENIILDGLDAESLCVGDVFYSDKSPLMLKLTFPRLACMRPDKKHPVEGLRTGQVGTVRHWVSATGRGGFFCRVLQGGDIGAGDRLKLMERPCPKWTNARLSALCYPDTPLQITWKGTREELIELCDLDELGHYEWKERLRVILGWSGGPSGESVCGAAMSGDGTLANVGIRLGGAFKSPVTNQCFDTQEALDLHLKYLYDPAKASAVEE